VESGDRKQQLLSLFTQYPERYAELHRQAILNGVVVLDMTTLEAKLAGGAFAYQVKPDASTWSKDANPLRVIDAQAQAPDETQIWLTFQNTTQVGKNIACSFRVHFQRGRAVAIEVLREASDAQH
jgi:hypothetical protein